MSRNWIAPKCKYSVDGKVIRTDGTHIEKISGTSLGAMLGKSPYGTPFTASTKLLGVWDEDISDKPAVRTGVVLEERIIDYLSGKHPSLGTFLKAKEVYDVREGDHSTWSSDFEDDVFAGHVDGIISKDGNDYILEVKTASRRQIETRGTWINGVPEHYLWQVYLYNHFITKQDKAYFLLGIVDEDTYANPYLWVACKDNCKLFEVSIDRDMVAKTLENVKELYMSTIKKGVSCECTEDPRDTEIMNYLMDISGTSETLQDLISEYTSMKTANKFYLDMNKANMEKEDELKERIKTIMDVWNMSECANIQIKRSSRKSFDFAKASADGLDVSPYVKETTVKTIYMKKE